MRVKSKKYAIRQFPIWSGLTKSWYSRAFYRDVALAWRGMGLGYLFILIFFLSALTCIALHGELQKSIQFDLPGILEQLPKLEYSKGTLRSLEPKRYTVTHESSGRLLMVIDTSLKKPETIQTETPVFIVGREKIWLQASLYGPTREFIDLRHVETLNIAKLDRFVIDRELVREVIYKISKWVMLIVFPFFVIMSYFGRLVEAMLFALLAYFILQSIQRKISYGSLLRLIILAQTPSILVAMLAIVLAPAGYWLTWIAVVLSAYYTVFSIYAAFFDLDEAQKRGATSEFEDFM